LLHIGKTPENICKKFPWNGFFVAPPGEDLQKNLALLTQKLQVECVAGSRRSMNAKKFPFIVEYDTVVSPCKLMLCAKALK
jgi:hypothetical protein